MEYSLEQLHEVAGNVLEEARRRRASEESHATLITFSGDLGAGKTTLIQAIAQQLGILENLQSPTYVIYKKYENLSNLPWKNLIHGDMYRLASGVDIEKLGWHELLENPENIICIEWPEKITEAVPDWAMKIFLSYADDIRKIDIT